MFRQASSRNHRNKGLKVKHVLQICLLLAVCIWLLYQIKHSHDKKKAFDESNAKIANKVESSDQILKLGRKDQGAGKTSEKHGEEEEREEEGEGNEDEMTDKERGDGDDEIDENDQEKVDEAAERGEEFPDEDKEVRKKETEEKEENDGQIEDVGSTENHDHDGEDRNTQEAREEHYKADDASSAVVRDNQMIRTEVDNNEGLRNSDEEHENNMEKNDLENDHKTNATDAAAIDQNDSKPDTHGLPVVTGDGESTVNNNATGSEKGVDVGIFKLENESLPTLLTTESINHLTLQNNATGDTSKTTGLDQKNETTILDSPQDQNAVDNVGASDRENPTSENVGAEQTEKPDATNAVKETQTIVLEQTEKSNPTTQESHNVVTEQSEKSNTSTVVEETPAIVPEQNQKSNATTVAEESQNVRSEPAAVAEKSEKIESEQSQKSNTTQVEESGDNGTSSSTKSDNADAGQDEPNNSPPSLVTQEERDAITDLGTLPHIESEGRNTEDVAAE